MFQVSISKMAAFCSLIGLEIFGAKTESSSLIGSQNWRQIIFKQGLGLALEK